MQHAYETFKVICSFIFCPRRSKDSVGTVLNQQPSLQIILINLSLINNPLIKTAVSTLPPVILSAPLNPNNPYMLCKFSKVKKKDSPPGGCDGGDEQEVDRHDHGVHDRARTHSPRRAPSMTVSLCSALFERKLYVGTRCPSSRGYVARDHLKRAILRWLSA